MGGKVQIQIHLEVKSMYTFKRIEYYWMNKKKKLGKYLKLCANIEPSSFSKYVYGGI